ncbi:STAS domain-containing protein [Imhoffiella purpurea]|uniref:RsbR, positive regulator of sigma-B n=1 Tax=Imhoffiella purpurea TaxID=1249627 RepID=W9VCZ9_9GAMM|nr:STAS domain-containing protein [Imhoffiella purpurea]EXJ13917.1 RsbR, positive regulator of sigma-B [Imhoffiella purpurea]
MATPLIKLLHEHREELLDAWLHHAQSIWSGNGNYESLPQESRLRLRSIFDDIATLIAQTTPDDDFELNPEGALANHLHQFVTEQARIGSGANKTIGLMLSLKHLLSTRLFDRSEADAVADLMWLERIFDSLTQLTFTAFVDVREHLITQQSLSLLELSTPVLRLWSRILLLPLVGVIDTIRARQITERLLEAIARHEARVTILDLTGVPVIDTSVAQHLMKTIDAARLLGTQVVMTGISPEGAQTLTKLGIRFGDVLCRATLRAGIAEALLLTGQRISPVEERRS